jgi:hypothetical protein
MVVSLPNDKPNKPLHGFSLQLYGIDHLIEPILFSVFSVATDFVLLTYRFFGSVEEATRLYEQSPKAGHEVRKGHFGI